MTTFAIHSPVAVTTSTPGLSPGALPPPATPTTPVRPPLTGVSSSLVTDLTEASRLVGRTVEMLGTVPTDDVGSDATKDLRIRIFKTNTAAQSRLEKQLTGNPDSVVSDIRKVDAYLEDSNWQIAKKPSPDGRFNGVDIPGAVRDANEGALALNELLVAAGGSPTTPATPPPAGPPETPSAPPTPPPTPATTPTTPTTPTTTPDEPTAPPATPGGAPDPAYPGEDEFPTDDTIQTGGDS